MVQPLHDLLEDSSQRQYFPRVDRQCHDGFLRTPKKPLLPPASWSTLSRMPRPASSVMHLMQLMHYHITPCHWPYPLTYPHWPKFNRMRISPQRLRVPPLCYNPLSFPPKTTPFSVTLWLQGLLALMYLKNYDVSSSHNSLVFHTLEFVPHNT